MFKLFSSLFVLQLSFFDVFVEVQLKEDRNEFSAIKTIYEGYTRKGDTEKFYGKYYATVAVA